MTTILLKLSGPLQSYGNDSHFETRQTARYPTKSAIIGMIAASMGLNRNQDQEVQELNEIDLAVRVDQSGELLRDFHMAHAIKKDGKPKRAYVTNRYYLQDAVFVVAISANDVLIKEITKALKSPYFQPFMGRRSLPLMSDFFLKVVDQKPIVALQNLPWQASNWYQKKNKTITRLDVYADADLLNCDSYVMSRERVLSFSQQKREHGFRPVKHSYVSVIKRESATDHDIFSVIEGVL
ncbi:type I-E CRISPR-associated protein Cas5/CasD [Pseudolactococcus plantarum]|uniref:CRISPR-associated protein Cas5 n=1 Tax=Pseudolactococcus plantarum TaxID=1365 RepID=A0A2A5S1R6_9LACT|nr:type I-E CRISPR-associated protein Cas5/CasD [Lactococcus plantarum]PCS07415.1 CRISPR-associated protein Cas5 [Lactococcus plantarum]HCN74088.1 type I-E CRISPR-associated protein Cas5/CasD [Lactococcus sp.]